MSEDVRNSQILQAITELSGQVRDLSKQMKQTDEKLNQQMEKLNAKVTVLSEELLDTQAEVKILKSTK